MLFFSSSLSLHVLIPQKVDMLLLLPGGPNEVAVGSETFLGSILPPVALLEHTLDNGVVVAGPHVELLGLVDLALTFPGVLCRSVAAHVSLYHALRDIIGSEDGLMQHTLHLDFHVEYELSTVEELSQGRLGVKLPRNLYIDLLGNLLQLSDAIVFDKSVGRGAIQRVRLVGRRDSHRVLIVLEDEPDDVVDCIDSLVDPMGF